MSSMQLIYPQTSPESNPLPWASDCVSEAESRSPRPQPLDELQFAQAFKHGYQLTLRFLLSRGAQSEIAEEVAQAAWARGWECRWQLQQPNMVGAWVNSIAKNMLRNRIRSEKNLEGLTDDANSTGPHVLSVDVERILNRCDQRDSRMLRGFYMEGYTSEELAEQVGLTPVAVRVRLLRIRRALRSELAKTA